MNWADRAAQVITAVLLLGFIAGTMYYMAGGPLPGGLPW